MNILILHWGAYTEKDIVREFRSYGIHCDIIQYPFYGKDKNHNEDFSHLFSHKLKENTYDAAFSVNYFPIMAELCHSNGLRYLSWSYDAPLNIRHIEDTLGYSTNRAFFFDRLQAIKYQQLGFHNCHHLPLGISSKRLSTVTYDSEFHSTISFVGNLYASPYPSLSSPLQPATKGYLRGLMDAQQLLYGCFFLDELITHTLIDQINHEYRMVASNTKFQITKEELLYAMATQITFEERHLILGLLSKTYPVTLYSKDRSELLPNVCHAGSVSYEQQMPLVFASSDINLNISHKMLVSGIPLRALDILGCGGFLLSNYQPELAEYFAEGKEWVAYTSMEDALDKCAFYLKEDELRRKIAASGREKVQEQFDYSVLIAQLLKTAGLLF